MSPQRRQFKQAVGQANHFLITVFVGLDAVADGSARPGPTFSTTWNPKDPKASARRSRAFVQRATLSLLIDSLDAYISESVRSPELIQVAATQQTMRAAKDATERFDAFTTVTRQQKTEPWALMHVARMWRHRLVHQRSRATLHPSVRKTLLASASSIKQQYQGLDVREMIDRAESSGSPRFKEAAAMFRAAHSFVERADSELIGGLDIETFCQSILDEYVMGSAPGERVARVANVWGKDPNRRERTVENLLRDGGLSISTGPSTAAAAQAIGGTP